MSWPGQSLADKTLEQKARDEFKKGVDAQRNDEPEVAYDHYVKSIDLKPHPRTYFNLGIVSEELGKYQEAYQAFQNFVRTATSERDRGQIDEVNKKIAQLRDRLEVVVLLKSTPDKAQVYVDGATNAAGETPLKMMLARGSHRIRYKHPDREDTYQDIEVSTDRGQEFSTVLDEKKIAFRVSSNTSDAMVIVDGKQLGIVSDGEFRVARGTHSLVIRAEGYIDAEKRVPFMPTKDGIDLEASLGKRRSTNQWITLGGLATGSLIATGIAIPLAFQANGEPDSDEAFRKANIADAFGFTGAALGAAAVIYFFVTRNHSDIEIRK